MIKNRKHRPKKAYNWDLRNKRQEKTISMHQFPMMIREKPTAHKQYCFHCRSEIAKGQMQILLDGGVWVASGSGDDGGRRFTSSTGDVRFLHKEERLYPRKIYLHTHCFGCLVNKMFSKAGLEIKPDCEKCNNKFNCWTNNIDITDIWNDDWYKPGYTPSRPCAIKKERDWSGMAKNEEVDIWNL